MAMSVRKSMVVGVIRNMVRSQSTSTKLQSQAAQIQRSLPCSYYRGGTSRALFFHRHNLPSAHSEWSPIFRSVLGSPDQKYGRQLDGMGGGISSLSKMCIASPSARDDADVDFTFAAVGVKSGEVDLGAACGNMTAAVGPWAVDEGVFSLSDAGLSAERIETTVERDVTVRIFNTNTSKIIHATFSVIVSTVNGKTEMTASTEGAFSMDGVANTAAPVRLSFRHPAGSKTGRLLPTSNVTDAIDGIECTLIDVGNPAVFIDATAIAELPPLHRVTPEMIESTPGVPARLEHIRTRAAVIMGISSTAAAAPIGYPKISLIGPAANGCGYDDVTVRSMSVGQPHKAIPITSALAVAAAADLKGSVVNKLASDERIACMGLTIGHPTGTVVVTSRFDGDGTLVSADVYRTARRIMEGKVFYREEWG